MEKQIIQILSQLFEKEIKEGDEISVAVRKETEEDSIYEGVPARKRQGISATLFAKYMK